MSDLGKRIVAGRVARGISQTDLARILGYTQTALSEIEVGKVTSPRKWRKIADALGIPHDEMSTLMLRSSSLSGKTRVSRDAQRTGDAKGASHFTSGVASGVSPRRIPVFGQVVGGAIGEYIFNGIAIDCVDCPPSLESVSDAYAVFVDGDRMGPRYDPCDIVWVHPGKPVRPGDDVVVQVASKRPGHSSRGFINRFVGWEGSKLKLRQLNPEEDVVVDRDDVVSVHPIVFVRRA